ncbi:MAG: ABC transporter permease [Gammaproteobacteria bacterium]|nr:ABC transporter permease [Gammaproteobacteria bacterium]
MRNLSSHIALRYLGTSNHSHLSVFMSRLAVLGLVFSTAILILVLSVMNGFDREMRESILGVIPNISISTDEITSEHDWDEIKEFVEADSRVISAGYSVEAFGVASSAKNVKAVAISGIDPKFEARNSVIENFMIAGGLPGLKSNLWGIVLGRTLGELLEVEIGESVEIFSPRLQQNPVSVMPTFKRFTVVGIYDVGTQTLDSGMVMINIEAARRLIRSRSEQTNLNIRIEDVLNADEIALDLIKALPENVSVVSWTSSLGNIYENIRLSKSIVGLMLWFLVMIAVFNLVVSLRMVVREKRGDIAILKTMGGSQWLVAQVFLLQGLGIAVLGAGVGLFLGVLGALNIDSFVSFLDNQLGRPLMSKEIYPLDFLPIDLRILDLALIIIGVVFLSVCASLVPAYKAAKGNPIVMLRGGD